jgi:hypothetical protein
MSQDVALELCGRHKDYIEQLLNLRVPYLSVLQDLTDKVHGLLFDFCRSFRSFIGDNCADQCVSSCNVQ